MVDEPIKGKRLVMERVRAALSDDCGPPRPVDWDLEDLRLVDQKAAGDCFIQEAEANGCEVVQCRAAELGENVAKVLSVLGAVQASVGNCGDFNPQIEKGLAAAGCKASIWQAAGSLDPHYDVDCGIGLADYGLADSGSLVLHSGADQGRGVFLVPPVHLAVLPRARLLPDLIDYLGRPESATARTIVTGPSKTADIEGVLITGMHGPRRLVVFLVDHSLR